MNKTLLISLYLLAICFVGPIKAQNAKLDSLENLLKNYSTEDTVRINLLNDIVQIIYTSDSSRAHDYAYTAVELSEKLNFKKGKARSFYLIGLSLSYNKSDKLALDYFLKALKIAEEINYKQGIANCSIACGRKYADTGNIPIATEYYLRAIKIGEELNNQSIITKSMFNLSVIYTGQGNYSKALEEYQKILEIVEKCNDKSLVPHVYNNIGEIHKYQGNYPQALENYHKCLKIFEDKNDQQPISMSFLNIGSIYTLQGEFEEALKHVDHALKIAEKIKNKRQVSLCCEEIGNIYLQSNKPEALEYLQKGLTIAEELSYQTPILNISSKIGDFYRNQGNYAKALEYYARALKISEELKRKRTICETCIKISGTFILQKQYGTALNYSHRSLTLAEELKLLGNQKDVHHQLSEIYAATNDYKKAYLHHKLFTEVNDRVYNEKNVKKIAELEYLYKLDKEKQAIELEQQKKDAVQAAEKKQQQIVIFLLIVSLILMSSFAIFIFRSSRMKHKTNLILSKQKQEIEELNEEYRVVNEELVRANNELSVTKKQVEERENLLIQISDNIPVYISLVNTDSEYIFVNKGYAEILNLPKEAIVGKKKKDILDPETFELEYQNHLKVMEGETLTFENSLKSEDGSEKFVQTTNLPYYQNHILQGVLVCSSDITERKKADLALQEIEAAKAQLLTDEIKRINQELETNQKSMTAATLKLIQNSERDAQTIERLLEIEKDTNPEGKQKIKALITENKRISYNSNWEEFEILFEKVHRSFYEKLNTQFPTLTANERKMCAFLKLNMSNKDIAQITFQSDDALKKARLRLRQKLGIDRETNLATFLQNI